MGDRIWFPRSLVMGTRDGESPIRVVIMRAAMEGADRTVFDRFRLVESTLGEGMEVDSFLGTVFRREYNQSHERACRAGLPPAIDDEHFEWVVLLESVLAAGPTFTFLELGASYGRWSVRAAFAAGQQGRAIRLACVEADPTDFSWLIQPLPDNNIESAKQKRAGRARC